MYKMKIVIYGLIASMLLSTKAFSGPILDDIVKTGEFRVCLDAGYMPFEMKSKNGDFIGFGIDLDKALAKAMGVKFVPVNTAWDGIIPALLTGKCHMINAGMTITAERNMRVNFADPYVTIGQTVILNKELQDKVKSYKDLNSEEYTIAVKLGTTGERVSQRMIPKAKMIQFETQNDAIMEVINGKADAVVYDLPFNAVYVAQNGDKLVHLDTPFTYEPLGWAVAQGDPDFLNFLNNFLQQIRGDGSYDRMYDRWFKSSSWLDQVQ